MNTQADITLTDWLVLRISADGLQWDVILGWCESRRCGRVTTPVETFVAAKGLAITRSGRRYRLVGPPGRNSEAIQLYAHTFGHIPHKFTDVTSEFLEQMTRRDDN